MRKRSVIWTIDKQRFQEVVGRSSSFADIFRHFGFASYGNGYKTLKQRMDRDGIDYSHIRLGFNSNKGRKFLHTTAIPLERVMTENSTYNRCSLKRRLIGGGLLENKCSICGQNTEWAGKNLVMVLDHINGRNNDHRLENLRLVCPNCNSQLETSNGKNRRKKRNCPKCGRVIWKTSSHCRHCRPRVQSKRRPEKEQLERMVREVPMTRIGQKFGVSDNAVRKWCRGYGIETKDRRRDWMKNCAPVV